MPDAAAWTERLATHTSRRGVLARVGGLLAGSVVAKAIAPGEAEGHHFCGHIATTASCPHPTGLPRIDARGFPLRAKDGVPVDDLGRRIDGQGRPVDEAGRLLTDPGGRPLPVATRTNVCSAAAALYGFKPHIDGSWHRCCGGHVPQPLDCCGSYSPRPHGGPALTRYRHCAGTVVFAHPHHARVP